MSLHAAPVHPSVPDVWFTRCQVPTAFALALQAGLFSSDFPPAGPALRALQDAADPAIAQSHFTHSQPNSLRHGSNYPAIWAHANGADTRVVAMSSLRGAQTVLTLPDSGIASPADLKGKRLLVLRRPHEPVDYLYAVTLRIYEAALATAGLTLNDVQLVEHVLDRPFIADRITQRYDTAQATKKPDAAQHYGQWRDLVYPLLRGEVDAITSGGGIGAASELLPFLLGFRVVFDLASLPTERERANNSTPLVFAIKADLASRHPEIVDTLLLRALEAHDLATRDPDQAIRCIAREQSVPELLVKSAYGKNLAGNLALDINQEQLEALQDQIEFLHRKGLIAAPFDASEWVVTDHLERARTRYAAGERALAAL